MVMYLLFGINLFGTFQKEEEEPVYGLTNPLNTYSFLWQHFHFIAEIAVAFKTAGTFKEKVKVIFGRPANFDAAARAKAEAFFNVHHIKQTLIAKPLSRYVIWQMIVLLASLFVFILFEAHLSTLFKTGFASATILTLINCGAIMEQRRWIFHVELLRICSLLLIPFCYNYYLQVNPISVILCIAVIIMVIFYHSIEKEYLSLVYRNDK